MVKGTHGLPLKMRCLKSDWYGFAFPPLNAVANKGVYNIIKYFFLTT
jgi:hypothetical protein